jgi:hypothetical protein
MVKTSEPNRGIRRRTNPGMMSGAKVKIRGEAGHQALVAMQEEAVEEVGSIRSLTSFLEMVSTD